MKRTLPAISLAVILLCSAVTLSAGARGAVTSVNHTDSVMINFKQSKWDLDLRIGDNASALDSIDRRLTTVLDDSIYRLRRVSIYGGASPEGTVAFNKFLSEQRAATLFRWFDRYNRMSDIEKTFTFLGRDWEGVLRLAGEDTSLPYREETLALLKEIADEKRTAGGHEPAKSLERVKQLHNGEPYRYLYRNIFPKVRASKVIVDYDRILAPGSAPREPVRPTVVHDTVYVARIVYVNRQVTVTDTVYVNECHKGPFYMDIRTNMLYDIVAVPNIGVEFYLGKNWTIAANYMHAWWSNDRRHRYWRIYGGELNVRRWFGSAALDKPLTGHHLGMYVQALTYDFEWGGTAHMGGQPGGTIFDLAHFGGGVEYGYSLPVGRRLNIDFTLGVGYIGGRVYEFVPDGDRYLWTATKNRHWFGPTKIEVSLAWLIGRGNVNNRKKGGER